MKELKRYLKEQGILGIGWAVFEDYVNVNGTKYVANSTVEYYCEKQGFLHNMTATQYAKELLEMLKAPRKRVLSECPLCSSFIVEGEVHACN